MFVNEDREENVCRQLSIMYGSSQHVIWFPDGFRPRARKNRIRFRLRLRFRIDFQGAMFRKTIIFFTFQTSVFFLFHFPFNKQYETKQT